MTETGKTRPKRQKRQRLALAEFATANPVVVVSSVGALAYFATRLGQTSFYSKFGLEPEDVGLGYAVTLSRAAVGLLLVLLPTGVYLLARWFIPPKVGPRRVTAFLIESAGLALLIMVFWMPLSYTSDANGVRNNRDSLRPAGLSSPFRIITNPLGIRVEPVRVSWVDETHAAYDFGTHEVMYLGRADGIAVFFDPTNQQTVRVPESDVVIEREQ